MEKAKCNYVVRVMLPVTEHLVECRAHRWREGAMSDFFDTIAGEIIRYSATGGDYKLHKVDIVSKVEQKVIASVDLIVLRKYLRNTEVDAASLHAIIKLNGRF